MAICIRPRWSWRLWSGGWSRRSGWPSASTALARRGGPDREVNLAARRKLLQQNTRDFAAGKVTVDEYLEHLSDDAEAAGSFRDALVRHRRSMLDLNTAVGLRVLP